MNPSSRRAIGACVALAVLIAIAAHTLWELRETVRQGWAGLSYLPAPSKRSMMVKPFETGRVIDVYSGGPASRAGIKRPGVILSINSIPVSDVNALAGLANELRLGQTVVYRVRETNLERDYAVRFGSPFQSPVFLGAFVTTELVALVFIVIGFFVFWRLPTDARAVIFFVMTLFAPVGLAHAAIVARSLRGIAVPTTSASALIRTLAPILPGLFFAPLLLHLALIFPKRRPVVARRPRLITWIYVYPVYLCASLAIIAAVEIISRTHVQLRMTAFLWSLFAVIAAAGGAAAWRIAAHAHRSGSKEAIIEHPLATLNVIIALIAVGLYSIGCVCKLMQTMVPMMILVFVVVFVALVAVALYPIATFVTLFRSYRDSGIEERRQVKWPLWGTMTAVGTKFVVGIFSLVVGLLLMFRRDFSMPAVATTVPDTLSRVLYILIPLSFAFAILKYRLMNIDVIVRRTVLYSLLTAAVFVIYGTLVGGVGTILVHFAGMQNRTMVMASTIVVALIAVPLRTRLQEMVNRNLFRERRDYPLALRNISDAIDRSNGIDEFLKVCAEQIQQALQNRLVLIAPRREGEYVAAAKVGAADEVLGSVRVPVEIDTNVIPDPLRKLGATLLIPARTHRESLALLALGSKLSDEEFSSADLEFLTSAASQIALGTENLRLRDEEAEFEQARAMQQILLPKRFPQLEGFQIVGMWQPAHSVGGDYFDTLSMGDRRAGICIADVAGKGMPAALLMANLQAAVKASASYDAAPADVCERVKTIVGGNLAGGKFISFFYGVLDAVARTFTYSNAGHNPPILVRASGEVNRLTRGGPAICRLFRDAPHEQETTTLASGDRIVLFTDGASEARRGEDEFGEDRLIALVVEARHLSAMDLQERIIDELRVFTSGNFGDDVTLVAIAAD